MVLIVIGLFVFSLCILSYYRIKEEWRPKKPIPMPPQIPTAEGLYLYVVLFSNGDSSTLYARTSTQARKLMNYHRVYGLREIKSARRA